MRRYTSYPDGKSVSPEHLTAAIYNQELSDEKVLRIVICLSEKYIEQFKHKWGKTGDSYKSPTFYYYRCVFLVLVHFQVHVPGKRKYINLSFAHFCRLFKLEVNTFDNPRYKFDPYNSNYRICMDKSKIELVDSLEQDVLFKLREKRV